MRDLARRQPPSVTYAAYATTPTGQPGEVVWSTAANAYLQWRGSSWVPIPRLAVVTDGAPPAVAATGNVGSTGIAADAGHTHPHGAQTDPAMHAVASATAAGFESIAHWTLTESLGAGVVNSAGAADASKVPKLDALGLLSKTFMPVDVSQYIESAAKTVYVSATGSDANDGLTEATAKLTLAGAWALLPATQTSPFILRVGAGTFTWTEPPNVRQVGQMAFIVVMSTANTVVASGTVTTSSTTQLVNTNLTTTEDQYIGYTMHVTSGISSGQKRHVMHNDAAGMLRPTRSFANGASSYALVAGDTFDLTRCATIFTKGLTDTTSDNTVHWINVAFTSSSNTRWSRAATIKPTRSYIFNLELRGNVTYGARDAYVFAGAGIQDPVSQYLHGLMGASSSNYHNHFVGWGVCSVEAPSSPSYAMGDEGTAFIGSLAVRARLSIGSHLRVTLNGYRVNGLAASGVGSVVQASNGFTVVPTGASGNPCLDATGSSQVLIQGVTMRSYATSHNSGTPALVSCGDSAQLVITNFSAGFTVDWTFASPTEAFALRGNSKFLISGTSPNVSGSGPLMRAFENADVSFNALSATQGSNVGSRVQDNARVTLGGNLTLNSTSGPALTISENALVLATFTLNCTTANTAATGCVNVRGVGAMLSCRGTVSITNTATTANIDGLVCNGGGQAHFASSPTISSSGSSGFGINCRGGGRVVVPAQPTLVTGPTADIVVGPNLADQYADTALAASFASLNSGMSCVQRST